MIDITNLWFIITGHSLFPLHSFAFCRSWVRSYRDGLRGVGTVLVIVGRAESLVEIWSPSFLWWCCWYWNSTVHHCWIACSSLYVVSKSEMDSSRTVAVTHPWNQVSSTSIQHCHAIKCEILILWIVIVHIADRNSILGSSSSYHDISRNIVIWHCGFIGITWRTMWMFNIYPEFIGLTYYAFAVGARIIWAPCKANALAISGVNTSMHIITPILMPWTSTTGPITPPRVKRCS